MNEQNVDDSDDMQIVVEPGAITVNDKCYLLDSLSSTVVERGRVNMEDSVNEVVSKIKKEEFRKRLYRFGLAALSLATLLIPDRWFYFDAIRQFDSAMESDVAFLHCFISTFFFVRFFLKATAKKKKIEIDDSAYYLDVATLYMVFDYDSDNMVVFSSQKDTVDELVRDIQRNRILKPCLEEETDV